MLSYANPLNGFWTPDARLLLICNNKATGKGIKRMLFYYTPYDVYDSFTAFATGADEKDARVASRGKPAHIRKLQV